MAPRKKAKKDAEKAVPAKKTALNPLPILQNDDPSLAQEMEDLFDEDRVTHRHGSTEPERD
jgi:hypothetical protein